jgi:iron complex outermembrane receptor protein
MAMRFGRQLFAALALCLTTAVSLTAQQTGTITGRVTDAESGNPLAGASIEVVSAAGRVVATGLSDQQGSFRIANVPVGTYTLVFMNLGHQSSRVPDVRVVSGETTMAGATLASSAFALNPVVVSVSRQQQKSLDAPGNVSVVTREDIEARPAVTPVDHLRSTPGVDVITTGVQGTNVVVRGFNNIFSGALHTLTDYRIAGVPSLRVNFMHFIPQNNDDFSRMEVVLGPGSALYGPNTANGVLHILTKSPLDEQGSTVTVAGGEQTAFHGTFRTAQKISETFGVKVSGQWFQAEEWLYRDALEDSAKAVYDANPAIFAAEQPPGLNAAEVTRRRGLVANRDFDIKRWSGDFRADWRPNADFTGVIAGGITNANGIELTGIGAGQAVDWKYSYVQARANYKRLFAQAYVNASDAGDTYLLRTGKPISDRSKVLVGQVQHGFSLGTRQSFTYGLDYVATRPETEGSINGRNEDNDNYDEYGAYLQSQTALAPWLDVVLAGRYDKHSELPDAVFSPRAGVVLKPNAEHSLRATYNQAFSTPTSLNLFLDIDAGRAPGALGSLGYRIHAQGPGRSGFQFKTGTGLVGMRSPFAAGIGQTPTSVLPVTTANLYDLQLTALIARSAAAGTPLPAPIIAALRQFRQLPAFAGIGMATIDPNRPTVAPAPLNLDNVPNVPGIEESTTSVYEVGYKGILGDKLLVAVDLWRAQHKNFTSPLIVQSPLLLLNPTQLGGFVAQQLIANGVPAAQAQAIAQGMASIPGAVVSSNEVNASGADLLVTYRNFGDVTVNGLDLAATALLSDQWQLGVTASFMSEDHFNIPLAGVDQVVALNSPKTKGSATLGYRNPVRGLTAELRVRHHGEFPANSAGYVGLRCIDPVATNDCVEGATLFDIGAGYQLPIAGASLQLSITNLTDKDYQSFIGVPAVGRMALLRLRYDF